MMQKVKNLYLGAIVAFLYAPIVVLIAQSFNASRYRGQWTGFTWEWYEKLVESEEILNAFSNTLRQLLNFVIATSSDRQYLSIISFIFSISILSA